MRLSIWLTELQSSQKVVFRHAAHHFFSNKSMVMAISLKLNLLKIAKKETKNLLLF